MLKKAFALTVALTSLLGAQNLVKNGDFGENTPEYGSMPSSWTLDKPADKTWGFANDDGVLVQEALPNCISFNNPDGKPAANVSQIINLKPNAKYVLSAYLKVKGCVPAIKIIAEDGTELTRIVGDKNRTGIWIEKNAKFNTAKNKVTVVLIGSINPNAKGTSYIDNVSIISADAAEAAIAAKNPFKPAGPNIALNKTYSMSPAPTYGFCKDPDDKKQLTDGVYTKGYFWTQKSTVGWTRGNPIVVTMDLGKEEPICGFSWNTAAGVAGVNWPQGLHVFVSSDNKNWFYATDLCLTGTVNAIPPQGKYSTFKYATNDVKTKGRYVKLLISCSPYTFGDEFEVFRGSDDLLANPPAAPSTTDPVAFYWNKQFQNSLITRYRLDIQQAKEAMASLPPKDQAIVAPLIKTYEKEIYSQEDVSKDNFKTIIPFNQIHTKILALNAYSLRNIGYKTPFFWRNNRWDNLSITTIPPSTKSDDLEIEMMRNEVRGETINICNPTDKPIAYTIQVTGLPEKANLVLCEVLFTDTKQNEPISAALKPADTNAPFITTVQAGCNRQIWLSFRKPTLKAGEYKAKITATADGYKTLSEDVKLKIRDLDFPKQPTMHMGGWDYTNGKATYYKTPDNLKDNLAIMRDIYVDSPWATNSVLPSGAKFDKEGRLTNPQELNFNNWNEWTTRWKGARNFCVFWSVRKTFAGEKMGTARFNLMVGEYVTATAAYLKKQGLKPAQLVLLLFDEPHKNADDEIIIAWSKAIRAVNSGVTLFNDPTYSDPTKAIPEMFEVADILCPNTPMMLSNGDKFKNFYINQRKAGRTLWLYSCSGPAKLLDPISYHRAQKWRAFEIGALGSFYWAMGCGGGLGDSWCAYAQPGTEFSPYFVSPTSTMQGKHSEAIREGVQDFEYLTMLQNKIYQLKKEGKAKAAAKAEKTLNKAVSLALSNVESSSLKWKTDKDRSLMDKARLEVLETLEELK